MKRRDARENAFLLIFEMTFHSEPVDELIELASQCRENPLDEYAERLVRLPAQNMATLDEKISAHLSRWKIGRLPKTTLAILRLAVCEIDYFDDISVKVTINEAVELAKRFASEEDAAYVNGVLGSYVRAQSPAAAPDGDESAVKEDAPQCAAENGDRPCGDI